MSGLRKFFEHFEMDENGYEINFNDISKLDKVVDQIVAYNLTQKKEQISLKCKI
jgi:hypothetical protein